MDDSPDLQLQQSSGASDPDSPGPARAAVLAVAAALLVGVAAGIGVFLMLQARRAPPAAPMVVAGPPDAKPSTAAPRPLGGEPDAVAVPPLDESDAVVRSLVRGLSRSPQVSAWLATDGLIRNFAVVVTNIAGGATPAKFLAPLRPASAFRAIESGSETRVDPVSYDRYATVAAAIASIDPGGAARLYATLKPRIDEAYHDLGYPGQSFDRPLEQAIQALLRTPIVDSDIPLKHKGIGYAYVDDRLETLTAAQKQYLRMGPRNIRAIDLQLRAIARALGIPDADLLRS